MNTQESKKLYNALLNKGYTTKDLGSEQVFLTNISDANKRRQLYDFVSSRGDFKIGDFNSYEKRLVGSQTPNPANWLKGTADTLKNQVATAAQQEPAGQDAQQLSSVDGASSAETASVPAASQRVNSKASSAVP